MPPLQPYVSNTPLVVAKNLRFLSQAGILVTEMLPIGMVGTTVADSPTTGYISRIGAVLSDQIDLYNTVEVTLAQYQGNITSLDDRVTALEISGTTIPSVNGYCYNKNSPILVTDMVELLTQDLCAYKPVLGTPSALTLAILAEGSAILNALPAFSQTSTMSALTGWVTSPETIADTINNLWVSYLDSRAGISTVLAAVTPTCAQVIIDFLPVYSSSTGNFNLFFSGYSFIPTGYTDGGSTIKITDGLGGILYTSLNVVTQSTTTTPLALSISGSTLSPTAASYTATLVSNVANASLGTTCVKTTIKNTSVEGGPPFTTGEYALSVSGSTTTFVITSRLSFTPTIVTVVANNSYTATQLSNAYYMTYGPGTATLTFVSAIVTPGTFDINWIAYK